MYDANELRMSGRLSVFMSRPYVSLVGIVLNTIRKEGRKKERTNSTEIHCSISIINLVAMPSGNPRYFLCIK